MTLGSYYILINRLMSQKKHIINIEGLCCPLPLPPPSPWETKSFRPAPLILYRFLSTSSLYSLSPLFILILSYHIYSIHNIIPLKCFRYCLTHIISIPLPSPIPLPPPPLSLSLPFPVLPPSSFYFPISLRLQLDNIYN